MVNVRCIVMALLILNSTLLLPVAPAGAVQLIPFSDVVDIEKPFGDQVFNTTDANGVRLFGSKVPFDLQIGVKLTTGHYSTAFGQSELNVNTCCEFVNLMNVPGSLMDFEFNFAPITLLTLSPLDPGVAGSSVSEPFTMTGQFNWPGVTTIDYIGQGTLTARWFPRDSPDFGSSSVSFIFNAPEPSAAVLLALGLGAMLAARLAKKRRRPESRRYS